MSGGILLANTASGLICLGVFCLPVVACLTVAIGGIGVGIYASNCRTRDSSRCRRLMCSASAKAFVLFAVAPTLLIFALANGDAPPGLWVIAIIWAFFGWTLGPGISIIIGGCATGHLPQDKPQVIVAQCVEPPSHTQWDATQS